MLDCNFKLTLGIHCKHCKVVTYGSDDICWSYHVGKSLVLYVLFQVSQHIVNSSLNSIHQTEHKPQLYSHMAQQNNCMSLELYCYANYSESNG